VGYSGIKTSCVNRTKHGGNRSHLVEKDPPNKPFKTVVERGCHQEQEKKSKEGLNVRLRAS